MEEEEDNIIYKVVLNHEDQYSIWPADKENPLGWKDAGKVGTSGMLGLCERSLDRYATAEPAKKHGAKRPVTVSCVNKALKRLE